ncbi:MAG TPA: MBL fold metallo-hydrolase [Terriglobales bacterium]|nr:MBL fold metallo-hydrolase [Terriglobales bacterium]
MTSPRQLKITYIGGPTAVFEWGGLRLLTDPGFDPPGASYQTGPVVLTKTAGAALSPESLGRIDVVLLSHDHHYDNLDHSGRKFLGGVKQVFTTPAGAERLGGHATGLANWQSIDVPAADRVLRITGTPARHGPAHGDRGPVTGFVLAFTDALDQTVYISGDTVWYEGVAEVARRFDVRAAVLFMGAATVPVVGPEALTMTAEDGIQAARAFSHATIIPLHYEGWAHFTESREVIARAFNAAGIGPRVRWMELGKTIALPI